MARKSGGGRGPASREPESNPALEFLAQVVSAITVKEEQTSAEILAEVDRLVASLPAVPRNLGQLPRDQAEAMLEAAAKQLEEDDESFIETVVKAIKVDPSLADAWVFLGMAMSEIDPMFGEAFYTIAVGIAHRAIPADVFDAQAGKFWERGDTRSMLLAMNSLGVFAASNGEYEQALSLFIGLRDLDGEDHFEAWRPLLSLLLAIQEPGEVEDLLAQDLPDVPLVRYARAIYHFQLGGDTGAGREALASAREMAPRVAGYLSGIEPMPEELDAEDPESDEVVAEMLLEAVEETEGAQQWIRSASGLNVSRQERRKIARKGPRSMD